MAEKLYAVLVKRPGKPESLIHGSCASQKEAQELADSYYSAESGPVDMIVRPAKKLDE
jgi:hypothetical protein